MNAEFFVVFGGGGRRGGIQYVIFPLQHYAKPKPFEQHAHFHVSVLFYKLMIQMISECEVHS